MTNTIPKRRTGLCLALIAPLLLLSVPPVLADKWHFSAPDRIVAIGDVHGAYDALIETLQVAGIIDDDLAWSGGKTHLVSTGDLLDRGADSRLVMDLIMRLEREASRAGGKVHLVLGNHEVMNLVGDLRYVADEEYASFLDMESAKERESWYQHFRKSKPADSDESMLRAEFNKAAPPGFFGHRRAFRPDGHYGKWLLKKPLMVVVNDTVFVHGGVPPYVAEHGLKGINVTLKEDLIDYVKTRAILQDAAVMSPIYPFKKTPQIMWERNQAGQLAEEDKDNAQRVIDLTHSPLHKPVGPTWYRGTASCSGLIEGDALDAAFSRIDANRVVMGHTYTVTRLIQQRMGGRTVEIDTGMLNSTYGGSGHALIIEDDVLSVVNQDGRTELSPIDHPVRVGHEDMALDDDGLEEILRNGVVTQLAADGAAWQLVHVATDEHWVFAYFRELPEDHESLPEVAAYRLDRLLQLGMIPVTVRREIEGVQGTLQFVPADAITERERVATGQGDGAPCGLGKQQDAMHVFDALINNGVRSPSTMLFSPEEWLLMLVDHEHSFGTGIDRPEHLRDVDLAIGNQWREALRKLDDDTLQDNLGNVLDQQQLVALGKRRDILIND